MNIQELQSYLYTQFGESESAVPHSGVEAGSQTGSRDLQISERLLEVEMASKMGYLLCQCSWPPQIMVLCDNDYVFRCPNCQRMRDF